MAGNNITYTNLYSYMNSLLYQIQSAAGDGGQNGQTNSVLGNQNYTGQSFADIYNTTKRLGVPESMDRIFEEASQKYRGLV